MNVPRAICCIGVDHGGEHCGFAVVGVHPDSSVIELLDTACFNLTTKRGENALKKFLFLWRNPPLTPGHSWENVGIAFEHNPFFTAHAHTSPQARRIERGQARWKEHVSVHASYHDIPILPDENNQTVRKIYCRNGHATKNHVIHATRVYYGLTDENAPWLSSPEAEHIADAAAVATVALEHWITAHILPTLARKEQG